MSNLNKLQASQENSTQTYSSDDNILKHSLSLAFERVNLPVFNTDNLCRDVLTEFKDLNIQTITKAIRRGSLGFYGKTYRMSTQELCIWINSYCKENKQEIYQDKLKEVLKNQKD